MASAQLENFRAHLRLLCAGRQEDIAKKAKISRVYLNKILNGHQVPSLEIAGKLADALGVPLGHLTSSPPAEDILEKSSEQPNLALTEK